MQAAGSKPSSSIPQPDSSDVLTEADLDAFSTVTNGEALPQDSKDEIREFLDTDKDGHLTLRGFIEMYHLQSDNEPEETWKDLGKLGFDDSLEYKGDDPSQAKKEDAPTTTTTSHSHSKNSSSSSSSVLDQFDDSDNTEKKMVKKKKNKESERVLFLDLNLTPLENDLEILGITTSTTPLLVTL